MTDLTSDLTLHVDADHLLIFVDDTGHEELIEAQPYYGLGGVILPAAPYYNTLRPAWCELRRFIKGSPDAALHASELGPKTPPATLEAISDFFRQRLPQVRGHNDSEGCGSSTASRPHAAGLRVAQTLRRRSRPIKSTYSSRH